MSKWKLRKVKELARSFTGLRGEGTPVKASWLLTQWSYPTLGRPSPQHSFCHCCREESDLVPDSGWDLGLPPGCGNCEQSPGWDPLVLPHPNPRWRPWKVAVSWMAQSLRCCGRLFPSAEDWDDGAGDSHSPMTARGR